MMQTEGMTRRDLMRAGAIAGSVAMLGGKPALARPNRLIPQQGFVKPNAPLIIESE